MSLAAGQAKKDIKGKDNGKKVVRLQKNEAIEPSAKEVYNPDELVFALDIGTRSVVGIVGIQENDLFKIVATEVLEHRSRAMLDGQIHDIEQVVGVVKEVKSKIEGKLGIQLKRAAIAAAGRVLKTCRVRVDRDIDQIKEIDQELISSLEIEGIQRAQMMLDEELVKEEKTKFYCVGYSVINYYLNGYVISRLSGHKGRTIGAEILATFLPHVVVDSLYTVMDRVGMEVASLTLEPIAAINVTIPKDLRLLNLALVDIGAGTSDIALTKDGSVVAYAMAPVAGDEITERITQHYLVDFNTAEKIKLSLNSKKTEIGFVDILKIKHKASISEVHEVIRPAVELLADTISNKILEFNSKAPNAVFLIGGGSQSPGLSNMIAEKLGLPKDRVVVRSRDVIKDVKFNDRKLAGPESVTPYGIAVTAQIQKGKDFLTVTVNGRKVKLFNSKRLSVADALILLGFNPGQLIGRTGKSISFTVNGDKRVIRGGLGKAAEIYVNSTPASLETYIKYGDEIKVIHAEDGIDAHILLNEALKNEAGASDIRVNGVEVKMEYGIRDGDAITFLLVEEQKPVEKKNDDLLNKREKQAQIIIEEPQKVKEIEEEDPHATILTVNGKKLVLKENKTHFIFVDIFNYIDFDLTRPQGSIVLRLNSHPAAFTDIIKTGDVIEIYWQK